MQSVVTSKDTTGSMGRAQPLLFYEPPFRVYFLLPFFKPWGVFLCKLGANLSIKKKHNFFQFLCYGRLSVKGETKFFFQVYQITMDALRDRLSFTLMVNYHKKIYLTGFYATVAAFSLINIGI